MIETIKTLRSQLAETLGRPNVDILIYNMASGIHLTAEEFYNQFNPEEIQKGHCNIFAKLEVGDKAVAEFRLRDMIGCSGIVIFNDLYVLKDYQNKGIASRVFDFVQAFAKYYGYGVIQATDRTDNDYSKRIFTKKGWNKVMEFKNAKTKHDIILWNLKLS